MILYLDASAGAKLFLAESESQALRGFLGSLAETDVLVSAVLLETELRRAAEREGASQEAVTTTLEPVELIAIPRSLYRTAGMLPGPSLRSLDALHLATAQRAEVDAILTYDQRLRAASRHVGVDVLAPT